MKIIPGRLDHNAGHLLQSSTVLPRPIAFVSTVDEVGTYNLAPFSSFAGICIEPACAGLLQCRMEARWTGKGYAQ
jgi:flavin reductase (DIM6/NTAB) family NADH-FMN oxidoreductase RutF